MLPADKFDYWKNELESVQSCPVCGGLDARIEYSGLRDCLENVPGKWSMRRCPSCDGFFLDPRPKSDAIHKAYRTYYTHKSSTTANLNDNGVSMPWRLINGYLNKCYRAKRFPASRLGCLLIPLFFPLKQQLDYFFRHLPAYSGRLLDVGCGNGGFLLRLKDTGWSALGLEPDPLAVRSALESGVDVVEGTLESFALELAFDVVTASHVIEHVQDPRRFLQTIYRSLTPGGTIWLATPNVLGLGHTWYRSAWRGLEPPRHLVLFSAKALKILLIDAGFVDVKFRRRGRGAKSILNASANLAFCQGQPKRWVLPAFLIDIAASLFSSAAEELVVTAMRPAWLRENSLLG